MNCKKCGSLLNKDDLICKVCGEVVDNVGVVETPTTTVGEVEPSVETLAPQQATEEPKIEESVVETTTPLKEFVKESIKEQEPVVLSKKKGSFGKIILIILILALIIGLGYFALPTLKEKFGLAKEQEPEGSNEVEVKVVHEKVKVVYNGYQLEIPEDYKILLDANYLSLSDVNESWVLTARVLAKDYTKIIAAKDKISERLTTNGYLIENIETKTIGNKEYVAMEVSKDNVKTLVALTNVEGKIFAFSFNKKDATIDYVTFTQLAAVFEKVSLVDQTTTYYSTLNGTYVTDVDKIVTVIDGILEQ